MDRGFFPRRQSFPRRRGGPWFHRNNIPNENFWMDGNWDMPQNRFAGRPPPQWNQYHPEHERPYDIRFDNCFRGSYERRPYRGPSYTRSKKTFSRGRGSFQKRSGSSCLISVTSKKKSEKKEKREDSKEIKQDKGNTAASGKEGVPSKTFHCLACRAMKRLQENHKAQRAPRTPLCTQLTKLQQDDIMGTGVKPEDSQPAEESPSQTASVASPGAAAQVELPSGIAEVLSDTKNGNTVLDKLKDCEATEDLLSQAVPILSPGVSTEDKTSSCSVEVLHNTEKEDSVLLQTSQSAQYSSHDCSLTSVEIPSLSENASDDQSERKEETELTETSAKQNDTDHCQACVAPALDSSSLPSTLSDIRYVPVLVREKDTGLLYSWEDAPFHAESQRGWAPEDYQEPPWSVNEADQCHKVSECYRGSESSVSSFISSNGKLNVGRLVECKSSSPKNRHSSNSKHSSTSQTPSPSSHGRQDYSSRSSHKRERSTERQERSSKLSCRREHSSRSSCRQENSPQREKPKSKSPYRQEQSSQKQECSSRTSPMQEHSVRSTHKQKHSSRSPKRKQDSQSQKLDRWKENKLGRGCCCHCRCQQSCSPSREGSWQRHSPPYLTCKIKCLRVSKGIGKAYRIPYRLSSESSTANEKKISENKQLVEPKIIEKKKRATSGNGRKALKSSTRKEKASSPCHLNAEEETSSSVPSKDHSAAVLARKEEIEQAYLQVLLNFGVIAIMLVEREPCMTEAMYSALRANLRKIGDYYESLLKNYIDSLTEGS